MGFENTSLVPILSRFESPSAPSEWNSKLICDALFIKSYFNLVALPTELKALAIETSSETSVYTSQTGIRGHQRQL